MTRTDITKSIRQALASLAIPVDARLYGSEARGDARPDSDIDLLILVDQPTVTDRDEDRIFAPPLPDRTADWRAHQPHHHA